MEVVLIALVAAGLAGCFGATLRVRLAGRRDTGGRDIGRPDIARRDVGRRLARPRTLAIRYE